MLCAGSMTPKSRYSERCSKAIALARALAQAGGSADVAPERLLAGLLSVRGSCAAEVLKRLGFDLGRIASKQPRVDSSIRLCDEPPLSLPAQALLNLASKEAENLGHAYIGTEHLLLASIRQAVPWPEGTAPSYQAARATALKALGQERPAADIEIAPEEAKGLREWRSK